MFPCISDLLTHYGENHIPLNKDSYYLREAIGKPLADHFKWLINQGSLVLDNDEPLSQKLNYTAQYRRFSIHFR